MRVSDGPRLYADRPWHHDPTDAAGAGWGRERTGVGKVPRDDAVGPGAHSDSAKQHSGAAVAPEVGLLAGCARRGLKYRAEQPRGGLPRAAATKVPPGGPESTDFS
jgi:hypothetical protein